MNQDSEVRQAESYVRGLFTAVADSRLLYHNIFHTECVAQRVFVIGSHYGLSSDDLDILRIAAWFHDVGHLTGAPKGHEQRSVDCFTDYAQDRNISAEAASSIISCIMATRMPHHPENQLEEIICDADTYNLGTDEFLRTDELLKIETRLRLGEEPTGWDESALLLLQTHRFFTDYCHRALDAGKAQNIARVQLRILGNEKI
jgi:hypothetical protein